MHKILIFIVLILALNPLQAETAEAKGFKIATAADQRHSGFADVTADLKMVLRDSNGNQAERELGSQRLEVEGDGDKVLLTFKAPADIRNTALLSHTHSLRADDQWLFLPSLKRVKRISSKNKSGPFVGSEFAFEDLSSQEVDKYRYKFLRSESCGGMVCDVVERYPEYDHSGYTRQVVWIEREQLLVLRTDYYDRKNSLLKTLSVKGYQQYAGKHWRPAEMHMLNHQTKKSTTLFWSNYQFGTGLVDRDFVKDKLSKGR